MVKATFEPGRIIERCEAILEAGKPAILRGIGMVMVAESQDAFKRQRFGNLVWPARGEKNTFGIIADFAAGRKEPFGRRFQRRPALMDTGRLRMTINFQVVGQDVVEVGSNLPYAAVHQYGGDVESERITKDMQSSIAKWLKGKGKKYKKMLGWLLNKKFTDQKLRGKVRARRFVGITKQTKTDIADMIGVTIREAL